MTAKYWQAGEVLDYTPSDNAVTNSKYTATYRLAQGK